MCGIAGILKFDPGGNVGRQRLLAMRDSLRHRGPDDAGSMFEGRIALGHRRLSIIDIAGGSQPMPNAERNVWLTYNGEIYNYRELRSRLQTRGCRFSTRSDSEVVLQAYLAWGENCVNYLRGMFAFAVWDGRRQRLFLARDRLGIKPLYYCATDTELLFGSEIKAILAGGVRPEFNRAVLPEFLATRFVAGGDTFFSGIHKLLPGHVLSWSGEQGFRIRRYWRLPATDKDTGLSRRKLTEQVRAGLEDAVQSHLVSDVPVGLFLSGGIDSSALAGLMAPRVDGPIRSFAVGFSESAANELDYARLAAANVGAEHRDVTLTPAQFFAALPGLIWHEDEPIAFTSSVPLHVISRLAREHVKVVLTGEGADELFLGYDYRYRVTAWNRRLGALYARLFPGGLRRGLARGIPALPPSLRRYAERTFLALDTEPRELFFENFAVFHGGQRQSLLVEPEAAAGRDPFAAGLRHFHDAGEDILQCMSHADLQTYLVELLMKQDQMSMSASLESRVPFLDHHLVEQVAAIPGTGKLRGWRTKAVLRDAVRDLVPGSILTRRKMGFPVPVSTWLQGRFQGLVEEFVLGSRARARGHFDAAALSRLADEHRRGVADHGERLWLLINLEMWQRIFIDGEDASAMYRGKRESAREITRFGHEPAVVNLN